MAAANPLHRTPSQLRMRALQCPLQRQLRAAQDTLCRSGEYLSAGGTCVVCPDGQYQDAWDHTETTCKTCLAGSASKGSEWYDKGNCDPCEPGTYQPEAGRSECIVCPDGTAAEEEAQTSCKACGPGTFSQGISSYQKSRCETCEAGSVQPASGKSSCILCRDGWYQDEEAQTACKICRDGEYQDGEGKTACKITRPGTYTKGPYDFQHAAEMKCDDGTYQPKAGQSSCLKCPGRTFQPGRGATACRPCRPGNVLDSQKTSCTPCWHHHLGGKSAAACKPFLAGSVNFSEVLEQNWQINGRKSKYVAQAVRRTPTSGRLHNPCARLMMDGKQKSLCEHFTVFILPNRDTRIRYQTRGGGQADCTIPRGRTSAKCLTYYVSEEIGSQKFEGTEHVIISGFQVTLGRPAGKPGQQAQQVGIAALPADPASTVANVTAPLP
ncbi:hypothetical protein ABPG75_011197 [Micractinium tetrahymenae]